MVTYILIGLAIYMVQLILEPCLRYTTGGLKQMAFGMSARDKPIEMSVIGGRLNRASNNMKEALPIFLTLALLAEMKGVTGGFAELGAIIFLVARVVYIPTYVIAFGGLRSIVWSVAVGGAVLMLVGMWPTLFV